MVEKLRPGVIATKAVNQYRSRDSFAYLGLRQLLKSSVARSDEWAKIVAIDQVIRREAPSYFVSEHFKDREAGGANRFRKIIVPSPVEVVAEAALLTECAGRKEFSTHSSVFTYHLADPSDRSGVFRHYMHGLRERHRAIEAAFSQQPNSVVRFLDLKKFYPSIRSEDIRAAWRRYSVTLPKAYRALGERLIHDHAAVSVDGSRGLLTGPMFSHFAANLVMRDFDEWASTELGVKYLRYVDDIALIGDRLDVAAASERLAERLKSLELTLHDENSSKTIEVPAATWLVGKSDFEHDFGSLTWGGFVSDIKSFLTLHPEKSTDLALSLADIGARLPVLHYASAVREARHAESFYARARRALFRFSASALTVDAIADAGRRLKSIMEREVQPMLDELPGTVGFARKRLIPKLRFRIGRLAYLSQDSVLRAFADASRGIDELVLQREVIEATLSKDLSKIVAMGPTAAQAAAQPLVAAKEEVALRVDNLSGVGLQGAAAAVLSGVRVDDGVVKFSDNGILDLSRGVGLAALKKLESNFISDIAFLAGKDGDHIGLLTDAFDEDEKLVFDAVERFEESAPRIL